MYRAVRNRPLEWVDLLLAGVLGYHYFLRVDGVLHPGFAIAGFLFAALLAELLGASRLRWWAALLGGSALIAAVGPVAESALTLFVGPQTAPEADLIAVSFSSQWDLTLPLGVGIFLLRLSSLRMGRARGSMTLIRGVVLLALFWGEAYFDLSLYHHPMVQAVVVGGFIVAEVLFLALLAAQGERRALHAPLASVLLPIVLLALFFLLGRYNDASLAGGGGLIRPTLFQFDFSDYLALESEISLSPGSLSTLWANSRGDSPSPGFIPKAARRRSPIR